MALSQAAQKAGADGFIACQLAIIANLIGRLIYLRFKMIPTRTDFTLFFVYNIPGRAVVNVLPETLARLAELPRIAGIKDATGNLERPWLERQLIKA